MPKSILVALVVALCLLLTFSSMAQITQGRWALSLMGGGNYWANDASEKKIGVGGDLFARYGITPNFSLGLLGGYHVLKTRQIPVVIQPSIDYYRAESIPVALVGVYHLIPNSRVNPYLFAGFGGMSYRVKGWNGIFYPDDKSHFTFVAPIGAGLEAFTSKSFAFAVQVGYRMTGDKVDLIEKGSLNGFITGSLGVTFFFGTSDQDDEDNDGLTNAQERRLGTNPKVADTDGDGLSDGDEVKIYHTNPLRMDTDGDGLTDGDEVQKYKTDPLKFDTDGDGLSDGDEILKYHTDPLKVDSDGDGLSDGDEVMKYHTDPLKFDSDGDGVSDGDEVLKYHTDPLKYDTDGDGLSDGEEVMKYHTDPLKPDTDGGGVNDGEEVKRGTNPLDPSDDKPAAGTIQLQRGRTVILEGVNFPSGSSMVTPGSETVLNKAYQALQNQPGVTVEIAGYTDDVGSSAKNQELSLRRAESVKAWLVRHGIAGWRMTTVGKGPLEPIAPNDSPAGRAKNRRIEFHVK
jgi:outer membrane protein OmpA-like peptidoglycan-associated protein